MKTLEELKAEQAAAIAKLETEHAIATLCPIPPHSVMTVSTGERAWVSYKAESLWGVLDILAKFEPLAFAKFKGTYTRYEPAALNDKRKERDRGEEQRGPLVLALDVDQGEGFGPNATFYFFAMVGPDICKIRVSLERGFLSSAGQYGASFQANPRGQSRRLEGQRYISGDFVLNSRVSSMAETYTKWGSGTRESCRFTYAFQADYMDDDNGVAGYDIDAIYRLENLATLMHGDRPEVTSE